MRLFETTTLEELDMTEPYIRNCRPDGWGVCDDNKGGYYAVREWTDKMINEKYNLFLKFDYGDNLKLIESLTISINLYESINSNHPKVKFRIALYNAILNIAKSKI